MYINLLLVKGKVLYPYEKINYLIEEKGMSKKEFASKFLDLNPRLRTTGEPPSLSSVYNYLSGKREIKVELIPYMAEALGVREQEIFEFDIEYSSNYNYKHSKEIREIIDLLQYLPPNGVHDLKEKLYQYKVLYEKGF